MEYGERWVVGENRDSVLVGSPIRPGLMTVPRGSVAAIENEDEWMNE